MTKLDEDAQRCKTR